MKKILFLLLFVSTVFISRSQTVLDGVFVKEHIPSKGHGYRTLLPLHLYYEFAYEDRHYIDCVADTLPKVLKTIGRYPSFTGRTFVNYHLRETDSAFKKMPERSCRLLFYRIFPETAYIETESFEPPFLKFRLDSVNLVDTVDMPHFDVRATPFTKAFITPFYIKNTEVTNAEYRAFTNYVFDSIARHLLFKAGIKKYIKETKDNKGNIVKSINRDIQLTPYGDEEKPVLAEIYEPENQRYYRRRETKKEKLVYTWTDDQHIKRSVRVYPDTLCWVHHFPATFNYPMAMMYYSHPAYDNYPVVGITRDQIDAFLHWMTSVENSYLAQNNKPYRVQHTLPNEMQWELASALQLYKKEARFGKYLSKAADHSLLASLFLTPQTDTFLHRTDSIYHANDYLINSTKSVYDVLQNVSTHYDRTKLSWRVDQKTWKYKYKMPGEITGMDNNVSEYLNEKINASYKKLMQLRWDFFEASKSPVLTLIALQEKTLFKLTSKGENLVRGGNWMDQRISETAGINAKCFVKDNVTYPTLGFRYVTLVKWMKK